MIATHLTERVEQVTPGALTELLLEPRIRGEQLRSLIMPSTDETTRARRRLHGKAGAILVALVSSYALILAAGVPIVFRMLAFPVLITSLIMVATSIMHDANHGAFFGGSSIGNRLVGCLADLLGVSSTLWKIKHDIHHADTNVQGIDADIDQGVIARLAPEQTRRIWHQWQHLYMWPLYGLMGVQWLLISDFSDLLRGTVAQQSIRNLKKHTYIGILLGKMLHVAWAIALPLVWYPWWAVALGYLSASWCIGVVLAVTFQIAHCVDAADFSTPESERRGDDFVWHQLNTTVDVRPNGSVLGRFRSMVVGGLDYQIEHHLAPHIPHTAYALMAERLRASCSEHEITYRSHTSVTDAVRSHMKWLRLMGARPSNGTAAF